MLDLPSGNKQGLWITFPSANLVRRFPIAMIVEGYQPTSHKQSINISLYPIIAIYKGKEPFYPGNPTCDSSWLYNYVCIYREREKIDR